MQIEFKKPQYILANIISSSFFFFRLQETTTCIDLRIGSDNEKGLTNAFQEQQDYHVLNTRKTMFISSEECHWNQRRRT